MPTRRVLPLLLLLFGCAPGPADLDWHDFDAATVQRLESAVEAARAEQNLPGLAMAVAYRDTREIWVGAAGMADLDAGTAWQPTHHTRIGSVTKLFTAAMVHELIDAGTVALDDPIEDWVPGWYTGPTVEHLLSNTSGIAGYNYVGNFDTSRPWTPAELVQWAYDLEPDLRFEPGSDWQYSNTNYVLLGMVIEAATGQSYRDNLQSRILDPLALNGMRLGESGEVDTNLVSSYEGEPWANVSDALDPSFAWSAGGMVSPPGDLARWTVALLGGEHLSAAALERMVTPIPVYDPDTGPYGLGAFVEGDDEFTSYGHTGGIGGYISYAYYLEQENAAVVVLSNGFGTDMRAAAAHGWALVLGVDYP